MRFIQIIKFGTHEGCNPKGITHAILRVLLVAMLSACVQREKEATPPEEVPFLNLNDTVRYVGVDACKSCHYDKYITFRETGMGRSFGRATRSRSAARFGNHAVVYDSATGYYYHPFWAGDSLKIREFRLAGDDTVYQRIETVDYIIGSGQHTNSHICSFNGYLYQAPVTYYTQKGKWDLAPGFEGGFNSRFSRIIGLECMTCHNGLPEFDFRSDNKYHQVREGIDCERCHGPGSLHVQQKLKGIHVDTAKEADLTIVNPRRLTRDQQMSLCLRCHLQGIAVLKPGKTFMDFRPGMQLKDVMQVFLPRFEGAENAFIMASQAERLMMSRCYRQSSMSCITCHNPHVSVKATPAQHFIRKCQQCHQPPGNACTAPVAIRKTKDNNCPACHMPKSGSIDIPHVAITDHHIRVVRENDTLTRQSVDEIARFIRLACLTDPEPAVLEKIHGYLAFYEKYSQRQVVLDSVKYLMQFVDSQDIGWVEAAVHYYYLQAKYALICRLMENHGANSGRFSDETCFRTGHAWMEQGNIGKALPWLEWAVRQKPLKPEYRLKLAACYFRKGDLQRAEEQYRFLVLEQPKNEQALSSLGYLMMLKGDYQTAGRYIDRALSLNPDYEIALANKINLLMKTGNRIEAEKAMQRLEQLKNSRQ